MRYTVQCISCVWFLSLDSRHHGEDALPNQSVLTAHSSVWLSLPKLVLLHLILTDQAVSPVSRHAVV